MKFGSAAEVAKMSGAGGAKVSKAVAAKVSTALISAAENSDSNAQQFGSGKLSLFHWTDRGVNGAWSLKNEEIWIRGRGGQVIRGREFGFCRKFECFSLGH